MGGDFFSYRIDYSLDTLVGENSDFCPKFLPIFVLNIIVMLSIHDHALDFQKFTKNC